MVLNGAIDAKLHVPFSVLVRSSFGYYFGYFCVISRCILAMFLGSVTTNGSTAVTVMIRAIWPSYANIPNHIETQMGITTQGMISSLSSQSLQISSDLYFCSNSSSLLLPPSPPWGGAYIKLVARALSSPQRATLTGADKAWTFLSCMSSVSGGLSTLACNIPDFSRYARTTRGQYIQLPFIPIIYVLGTLVGIIGTPATAVIYGGEMIWEPLDIYQHWIETGSSGARAGAFFCGAAWASRRCVQTSQRTPSRPLTI
ncbi:hypothetical protein OPQ81_010399 [Rhizoctonia solani]|nr:hypothetical protein OPQ81_010399 [Rhizoctonia solani]